MRCHPIIDRYIWPGHIVLRCLVGVALLAATTACNRDTPAEADADAALAVQAPAYRKVCATLEAIPAPAETAALLKRQDGAFQGWLLNPPARVHYYVEGNRQAMAIGVYGADMAYSSLYRQTQPGLEYVRSMQRLCQSMQLDQQVDFDGLQRHIAQGGALPDLLGMVNLSVGQLSARLQERGQLALSFSMILGGWAEGCYLLSQRAIATHNPALAERVAAQGDMARSLLALADQIQPEASPAGNQPQPVRDALATLAAGFDSVQTSQTTLPEPAQASFMPSTNTLTVTDARRSHAHIQPAQLARLAVATARLRGLIVD